MDAQATTDVHSSTTARSTNTVASILVLVAGMATAGATLFGLWALNRSTDDFNIMGWYANYVIPVGALLVGLAAGSGYGIASWLTGTRISRQLLWSVIALQVGVYFFAQYLEYSYLVERLGALADKIDFWQYFDTTTRSFAFKKRHSSAVGSALGVWGYGIRALEITGFAVGGIVASWILRAWPYCQGCNRYMKRRRLCLLPMGVAPKKIRKSNTEAAAALAEQQAQAHQKGLERLESITTMANAGQTDGLRSLIAEHRPRRRQYQKLTARLSLSVARCPGCHSGLLKADQISGFGQHARTDALSATQLQPQTINGLWQV